MLPFYINCVITMCAETGFVPPAVGVIVSAIVLSSGFLTVNIEFSVVIVIINIPEISEVPVALTTTVYAIGVSLIVSYSCPASVTGTEKNTNYFVVLFQ